jgi:hypothetical protein
VFEQLGPSAKSLALRGASRLVGDNVGPAGFAGIFTIDFAVHPVVNFTNNRAALDEGLKKVSMTAGNPLAFVPTVPSAEFMALGPPPTPGELRHRMLATLDARGDRRGDGTPAGAEERHSILGRARDWRVAGRRSARPPPSRDGGG